MFYFTRFRDAVTTAVGPSSKTSQCIHDSSTKEGTDMIFARENILLINYSF